MQQRLPCPRFSDLAGFAAAGRADHRSRSTPKREVRAFVEELRDTHDATILITTHDMTKRTHCVIAWRSSTMADRCTGYTRSTQSKAAAQRPRADLEDVFMSLTGGNSDQSGRNGRAGDGVIDGHLGTERHYMMQSTIQSGRAPFGWNDPILRLVARNWHLTKRYWGWEVVWLAYSTASGLAVTFIAAGAAALDRQRSDRCRVFYPVPAAGYAGMAFSIQHFHANQRGDRLGTLGRYDRYTLMAPVHRWIHLIGQNAVFGYTQPAHDAVYRRGDGVVL